MEEEQTRAASKHKETKEGDIFSAYWQKIFAIPSPSLLHFKKPRAQGIKISTNSLDLMTTSRVLCVILFFLRLLRVFFM
jgi:hypothetical protein